MIRTRCSQNIVIFRQEDFTVPVDHKKYHKLLIFFTSFFQKLPKYEAT